VFYTIQGEGPFAGHPSVFIRTGGCNLRCYWCDTDFESSTWKPELDELLARVDALRPPRCDLAVLTGGEPFRQNIAPLVAALLQRGLRVQIETAGTLWVDLPNSDRISIVCSPKTRKLHAQIVPRLTALKYVLAEDGIDESDGLPCQSTQKQGVAMRLYRPSATQSIPIYVMPRDDQDAERNARNRAACVQTALHFGYRLSLQIHKLIGLP
jgi:organic radical activating enzyme